MPIGRRLCVVAALHIVAVGLGLPPVVARAQPLGKEAQKCVGVANKGLAKLMKSQGKEIAGCLKSGATGKLTTSIDDCLTADSRGRIAKAQAASEAKVAKACADPPAFGSADPTGAETGPLAVEAELAFARALVGLDFDAAIVEKDADPSGHACQSTVAKLAQKCRDGKLKTFLKCKKQALKGSRTAPAVASAQELQDTCLGNGPSPIPDPKGKVEKLCVQKLDKTVGKKCAGQDTAALFPGCGADPLATCVDRSASCEVCLALNAVDELARDCDQADDQLGNGSCGVCTPGQMEACYTGPPGTLGVGTCSAGTSTCTPTGSYGACAGEVTPIAETCTGLDDDCDGLVDAADPDC